MALPPTVTPTLPGQSALSFKTEVLLLATAAPKGTIAFAEDTANLFFRQAATWLSLSGGGGGGGIADLEFGVNDALFPSSSPAGATSVSGHPLLAFSNSTQEQVIFESVVPSAYVDGDVTFKILWATASAAGTATYRVEIQRENAGYNLTTALTGGVIDSPVVTAAATNVLTLTTFSLTNAQANGITGGDAFRLNLKRAALGLASDTHVLSVTLSFA